MDYEYLNLWAAEFRSAKDRLGVGGVLVYRRAFDEALCGLIDGAVEHRVAIFSLESDAAEYCGFKNEGAGHVDVAALMKFPRIPA